MQEELWKGEETECLKRISESGNKISAIGSKILTKERERAHMKFMREVLDNLKLLS